jgi:hypothetical protein
LKGTLLRILKIMGKGERERLRGYARWIMSLLEGDTYQIPDMMYMLKFDGFIDEDGEWIEEDE